MNTYSSNFDKYPSEVSNVQTIGITQVGDLPLDAQKDALNASALIGDPGTTERDFIVPPMCKRGVTMVELMDLKDELNDKCKSAFAKKERIDKAKRDLAEWRSSHNLA